MEACYPRLKNAVFRVPKIRPKNKGLKYGLKNGLKIRP